MNEFNFTFGYAHTCPETGLSLAGRYTRIVAQNEEQARGLMHSIYKDRWAFCYNKEKFDAIPESKELVLHRYLRVSSKAA